MAQSQPRGSHRKDVGKVSLSKPPIKPILLWLAIGFMGFMILVNPVRAADLVGSVLDFALKFLTGLGVFFTALVG